MTVVCDINVGWVVVRWFRSIGHEAYLSTQVAGSDRASDLAIADTANDLDALVVSFDVDMLRGFDEQRRPRKLIYLTTGNKKPRDLIYLLDQHIAVFERIETDHDAFVIEIESVHEWTYRTI